MPIFSGVSKSKPDLSLHQSLIWKILQCNLKRGIS